MIPVSLRLNNFLSYGTDVEPLDFTRFDVACLSGANGQGKSALLDGITWTLWGQARKSSNVRKPDAELLRIGAQEMRVEFVFDIEGERYRAERWFSQSASGKTSKSGLEVAVYDGGEWRPLTAPSQSDTQLAIDKIVGVDYDTFVNASFLLQGRSDEFTRRKPEERKEVLTRILNLDRYEVLADRAGAKAREAQSTVEGIERDGAALDALVALIPEWEAHAREARMRLDALIAQRDALDARLAAISEKLHTLKMHEERVAEIGRAQARLKEQRAHLDAEVADLDARLTRAQEILAERDAVLAAAARHEALTAAVARLHEQALSDGVLESRVAALVREIEKREGDHAQKLQSIDTEMRLFGERIEGMEAELSRRDALRKQHAAATEAAAELHVLTEKRQKRDALRQEREKLDREVEHARVKLEADFKSLDERIRAARTDVPDDDVLTREQRRLDAEMETFGKMHDERDAVEKEGREVGDELGHVAGQVAALDAAIARIDAQQARLADESEAECPTCGTRLTDDHRRTVGEELADERARLEREKASAHVRHGALENRRAMLRERYRRLADALKNEDAAREGITRVKEQRKHRDRLLREIEALGGEHRRLRGQIENRGYAVMQRQRLTEIDARLESLPFDEDAFDAVQARAARLDALTETLERLAAVEQSLGEARRRVTQLSTEKERLRAERESGALLGTLPDDLALARKEREALAFDPAALAETKAALDALRDAPTRRRDLENARENYDVWAAQRESRVAQCAALADEAARLTAEQATFADVPRQQAEAEAAHREASEERRRVGADVGAVQQEQGALAEKLRQGEAAKAQRAEARKALDKAREEVVLYKHLRHAFSRKGIPSLIIEETLPEIEERANTLLDRLADGRMHIRLETLRDKKTGGTAETLDIIISDEMGVSRPYETFSGGEAFRVNFALRIALSQLLAERSGTRIRTLVVDEGFGTQDAQGVQRLIEAIDSVREDFDKILVVTHLEALKNAFPTRIEVHKDPAVGSRYEIIGA